MAREYRRQAERFAAGGRLRRRMDQTIRAFCTQPSLEAARALIECQNEIAHDAFGVMESFPIPNSDNLSQVVPLWQMIVAHIADEFGIEPPEVNEVRLRRQTLAVLADLRTEIDPVAIKYTRFRRVVMLSWLATLVGGPIVMVVGVIPLRLSWPFLVLWPLAAVGLHGYLLLPKYLDPWLQKRLEKQFQSLYQSTWRPRMFRHLHALAVPAHVMLQQLIVVAREMGDDQWLGWLFEFLQADEGFPLYAAAQPFVR
jgi:hypothetical protein